MITYTCGSLFDGIGGFPLAGSRHGITPVWASEIEPFPIKVTALRCPGMKHIGDITKINGAEVEPVDVIIGGSPCQDLSVAGKRAGLDGERSGLFMEMMRVIEEMLNATGGESPQYVVWENVPGALSSNKGEDFKCVLDEFTKLGFIVDGNILDAQHFGVPQRRKRICLVGTNLNYIAKKKTPLSESITLQLRTELLLILLAELLKAYGIEPEKSGVMGVLERPNGLNQRTRLFCLHKGEHLNLWQKNYSDIQQRLAKERESLELNLGEDPTESQLQLEGMLFRDLTTGSPYTNTEMSLREILDENKKIQSASTTSTLTKETIAETICTCLKALGNTLLLTASCVSCVAQTHRDSVSYFGWVSSILTELEEHINARQRHSKKTGELGWDNHLGFLQQALRTCDEQVERSFGGQSAPEILFEREGVSGDIAESRSKGKGAARDVEGGVTTAGGSDVTSTLFAAFGTKWNGNSGALTGDHFVLDDACGCRQVEVAKCIDTTNPDPSKNQGGMAVVHGLVSKGNGEAFLMPEKHMSLSTGGGQAGQGYPAVFDARGNGDGSIATYSFQRTDELKESQVASTQSARQYKSPTDLVAAVDSVRRLTPLECERLQGFPDNWTNIPPQANVTEEDLTFWRTVWNEWQEMNGAKPKTDKQIIKWLQSEPADSARYKALGNSIALPPWRFVLSHIHKQGARTMASLFDGVSGFVLIWAESGGITKWTSEIEPFPIAVTRYHFKEE